MASENAILRGAVMFNVRVGNSKRKKIGSGRNVSMVLKAGYPIVLFQTGAKVTMATVGLDELPSARVALPKASPQLITNIAGMGERRSFPV